MGLVGSYTLHALGSLIAGFYLLWNSLPLILNTVKPLYKDTPGTSLKEHPYKSGEWRVGQLVGLVGSYTLHALGSLIAGFYLLWNSLPLILNTVKPLYKDTPGTSLKEHLFPGLPSTILANKDTSLNTCPIGVLIRGVPLYCIPASS